MSRIGKKPVAVPAGINVSINNREVTIEKGKNRLAMTHRPEVDVTWDEGAREVVCTIPENKLNDRATKAFWGLTRSLIHNMVVGVNEGYKKQLEVHGVGWNAQVKGNTLVLNVGYADPVELPIPMGLSVGVERNVVTIEGIDKQAVGHFAATARATRKPEPYNGKGVRYAGEQIIRKEGKTVAGR
ncbi:MAG: 50S ribosomal protein L6 [Planctomycetota bacterium]